MDTHPSPNKHPRHNHQFATIATSFNHPTQHSIQSTTTESAQCVPKAPSIIVDPPISRDLQLPSSSPSPACLNCGAKISMDQEESDHVVCTSCGAVDSVSTTVSTTIARNSNSIISTPSSISSNKSPSESTIAYRQREFVSLTAIQSFFSLQIIILTFYKFIPPVDSNIKKDRGRGKKLTTNSLGGARRISI